MQQPEPPPSTVMVDISPDLAPDETPTQPSPTPSVPASPMPQSRSVPTVVSEREVLLDALTASRAVRGAAGACPGGGASIEITDDGGSTWDALETPTDQLLRLEHPVESDLWFVGAQGPDCDPAFTISVDVGDTWRPPAAADGAWHLLRDREAAQIHAPQGNVDSPCAPRRTIALEGATFSRATLLCDDGEVFTTVDAGVRWTSDGATAGARALALIDGVPRVAAFPVDGCAGLSILAPGAGEGTCVVGAPAVGVGLSFSGPDAGYLQANGRTWVSTDAGRTWAEAPIPESA